MEAMNAVTKAYQQGELSDCMYDVLWGKVGIYAGYGQENSSSRSGRRKKGACAPETEAKIAPFPCAFSHDAI